MASEWERRERSEIMRGLSPHLQTRMHVSEQCVWVLLSGHDPA